MNMFTRYLNSAAVFSPPDDARSEAQRQRDEIEVNVAAVSDDEATATDDKKEKETEVDEAEESDEEDGEDDDKEDAEEKKEEVSESDEDKQVRLAKEKEDRKEARIQRRIDKAVAERKTAEAEVEKLRRQLAEKPSEGLSEEEVERRAEEKAAAKIREQQDKTVKAQFDKDCDTLREQAIKIDKAFDNKISAAAEELGPIPAKMIGILADLDNGNGGEVLNYLADNIDDAEDIWGLSEGRMTAKLIRISDKLKEAKKPPPKPKTKVPPPVTDVNESGRVNSLTLTGKESTEDFIRIRDEQVRRKREQRGY